ncbi:hypothetical protein BMT54_02955 [Pasteurellaceae bacterium 15-036681]|nr:hypothetical protein BMT54_02955 [Pasteurellaceae bacterium 15-036681]
MPNWIITRPAQNNLREIMTSVSYYTGYVNSGIKLYNDLTEYFDKLAFMPLGLGTDIGDGKRQAFCRGYRIIYKIIDGNVYILTIIHSSRLYPDP